MMVFMETRLEGEDAMRAYAHEFIRTLTPHETHATIIGLSGDLGSGKTTFVRSAAEYLAIKDNVVSPTYVIAKFYDILGKSRWTKLIHVDAYRIGDPKELRPLKWENIIADPKNLIMIEWPEQIGEMFPDDAAVLRFRFINETTRTITS